LLRLLEIDPGAIGEQGNKANWPRARELFAAKFRTRTRDEWCALLEGTDACFAPVLSLIEAPAHPHHATRGTFVTVDGIVQPAPAPRFSRTVPAHPTPPEKPDARAALAGWMTAAQIDALYENSAVPTKTETESAYQLGFVGLFGNIGFFLNTIGMAVVFAILLVAANTMAMSSRERVPEVAVMKMLGFGDRFIFSIVLAEAFLISLLGTALGLGGALLVFNLGRFDALGFVPGLAVAGRSVVLALAIAAGLALASGLFPARRAARLNVIEALRHVA